MAKYLIVANQTIGGDELREEIRQRISAEASFFVLVPTTAGSVGRTDLYGDGLRPGVVETELVTQATLDHRAELTDRSRLDQLTSEIRAAGGHASGDIGPSDVLTAIDEILGEGPFDEIIVSTLPIGASKWLKMDVPSRVQRRFHVPVTTVTAGRVGAPA